jgi:flagellar P-ring protein precursor FlgI
MGGTVERENPNRLDFTSLEKIEWLVDDPDFTTASRISMVINDTFESDIARALDGGTVAVQVPPRYADRVTEFVSTVELLDIEIDMPARVVVNERTGTVVMGSDVTISNVAVAHGALSIEVDLDTAVSQPGALSGGTTAVTSESQITVKEADGELVEIDGVTIGDLVSALNSIGVKPRDLIQILLTIRAAGAMQAELEVI